MTTFASKAIRATVADSPASGTVVITLEGDLATADEPQLRDTYARVAQEGANAVRLHFKGVDYINSSGISVLIDLLRQSQEGGRSLSFSGLSPHYAKVFTFMGLTQYAPIVDAPETNDHAPTTIVLDRRKGDRRGTAAPSTAAAAEERRRRDRRSGAARADDRLVGALVAYMRANALSQADLAAQLGLSEPDLLDLAWQPVPEGAATTDALAARFGANPARLAAILAARPTNGIAQRAE
ncbi:MAG TPA: STAS domain-containing protein [Chloroflexota bacterium]|nr:STAS domain-containing protein [Chloroflexota bacterium]